MPCKPERHPVNRPTLKPAVGLESCVVAVIVAICCPTCCPITCPICCHAVFCPNDCPSILTCQLEHDEGLQKPVERLLRSGINSISIRGWFVRVSIAWLSSCSVHIGPCVV